jgi:nucleoside-diphosphate-sugar epimerase
MHKRKVFLTGATGMLGRYLLRDLLAAGREVVVLVRDGGERVEEVLGFGSDTSGRRLPRPVVLQGDASKPGLGLSRADRAWVGRSCSAALHAAACSRFRATEAGEPWATNVTGARHLLVLCEQAGIQMHHVSTAFVCGRRAGPVAEADLDRGQLFNNEFERSKCAAERVIHQLASSPVTVYRPAVIVGDSQTGYTSNYQGLYYFLELANRLAQAQPGSDRRSLPIRVPFGGDELRNLVPVNWVSAAITRLMADPRRPGKTYHLTATRPTPARWIKEVAEELLGIEGVTCTGDRVPDSMTHLEQRFLEEVCPYWPYRQSDPVFDCANTSAALPDLAPPVVDRGVLRRLIQFAITDRWGRRPRRPTRPAGVGCSHHAEEYFPLAACASTPARIPLDGSVGVGVAPTAHDERRNPVGD